MEQQNRDIVDPSHNNRRVAKMSQRIADKDYRSVFMEGGCCVFALVLHEELRLPLFYSCPDYLEEIRHAYVMNGEYCLDFEGWKPVGLIAEKYAEWADVFPRAITAEQVREAIKRKRFGGELEQKLFVIAREEFKKHRDKYALVN